MKKFNQKLIKDLKEGKIVLENRPKDSDTTRIILKEAFPNQGYTEGYFYYYYSAMNDIDDYECTDSRDYAQSRGKIIPISDFILPEQFTVGQQYEFQQETDTDWHKGKFLGVSDCKGKRYFLSEEEGFEWPVVNMDIREVQPKEITKEDLVGLLNDWLELWDNDLLATIDKSYNSTLDNLGMNTGSILHQLKNNLITQK